MKRVALLLLFIVPLIARAQSQISWSGTGSNLNSSSSGNEHPHVVMNAAGNPLVLWGHSNRAMFSRWNGTSFTTPVMLNPVSMTIAEAYWMGPDIATHGDTVYVVFKQMPEADTSSHIYLVRSFDGGINFSSPYRVDWIGDTLTRFPTVVADASGNPIVGYMRFDINFMEAQWVVVRSTDYGSTFSPSALASGWSSPTSTVCDCCPSSVVNSGNIVAMPYRDNNSNIRDVWAGISMDGGNTFAQGVGIDQGAWMIASCPASGPDAAILGDTLYTTYMSASSGSTWAWLSKTPLSPPSASIGQPVTGPFTGMTIQNYPRIDHYGNAMALAWKQNVNSTDQLALLFTNDISNGFPATYDTVDLANITVTDVALSNGNICVVWEDDGSGTVRYRRGTFTPVITSVVAVNESEFEIYPNPAKNKFSITNYQSSIINIEIFDALGRVVYSQKPNTNSQKQLIEISGIAPGLYFCKLISEGNIVRTKKIIIE